jgi:hypothetical protein
MSRTYQPGEQHPPEWREDLNPDALAGQNYGRAGEAEGLTRLSAVDVKALHERLPHFTDDELRQITVLPEGARLEQGATYIDLGQERPAEFTATAGMLAGPGQCIVPKKEVDYQMWNRLIGVRDPARTGGA